MTDVTTGAISGRPDRRAARAPATSTFPAIAPSSTTLAYEVVQQVNTLHDAGFTLGGVDAPPFFQPLAAVAGAASQIARRPRRSRPTPR